MGASRGKPIPTKDLVFHISSENRKSHLNAGTVTYLDGVSDRTTLGNTSDFNFFHHTGTGSVSLWFKLNDYTDDRLNGFFGSNVGSTNNAGISFWYENRSGTGSPKRFLYPIFKDVGAQAVISVKSDDNIVTDNEWHHVLWAHNGANDVHLYLDGIEKNVIIVTSGSAPNIVDATYDLQLGTIGNSSFYGNQYMSNLAFFTTNVSASHLDIYNRGRINPDYTDIDGLRNHWRLDSLNPQDITGSLDGTSVNQDSDNIRTLGYLRNTFNRSMTGSFVNGAGASSGSFYFDGVDDYIDCGSDESLDFERTDTFTISTWVNISTLTNSQMVSKALSLGAPGHRGYYFGLNGSNNISLFISNQGGNRIRVTTNATYTADTWYHIVITYDGSSSASGCHIYVNNIDETLTTNQDNLSATISNSESFEIGRYAAYHEGGIDETSVWNKELTSSEVTQIFEGTRRKYGV